MQASGDYLALVNPDLIVSENALGLAVEALSQTANGWIAGGCLLNMDGTLQKGGRRQVLTPWRMMVEMTGIWRLFPGHPHFARFLVHDDPPATAISAVPVISGAFMVLSRQHWQELGGLDQSLFLHAEDLDLCLRILKKGGLVLYCAQIPLFHQKGTSAVSTAFVEWHKTRSVIRYFFKHFTDTYPSWCLQLLAAALWVRFAGKIMGQGGFWVKHRWRDGTGAPDSRPTSGPVVPSIPSVSLE